MSCPIAAMSTSLAAAMETSVVGQAVGGPDTEHPCSVLDSALQPSITMVRPRPCAWRARMTQTQAPPVCRGTALTIGGCLSGLGNRGCVLKHGAGTGPGQAHPPPSRHREDPPQAQVRFSHHASSGPRRRASPCFTSSAMQSWMLTPTLISQQRVHRLSCAMVATCAASSRQLPITCSRSRPSKGGAAAAKPLK